MNLGAKSSQTQDVFHKFVEDTIAQSDMTVTISKHATSDKRHASFWKIR